MLMKFVRWIFGSEEPALSYWDGLDRNQRKVQLCQDALAQLAAENCVFALEANYCYVDDNLPKYKSGNHEEWFESVKGMSGCSVCARGMLLITKLGLYNGYRSTRIPSRGETGASATADGLSDCFTSRELEIIETAFEGQTNHCFKTITSIEADKLIDLLCDFDAEGRFEFIAKGIIEHDGDVEWLLSCESEACVEEEPGFFEDEDEDEDDYWDGFEEEEWDDEDTIA